MHVISGDKVNRGFSLPELLIALAVGSTLAATGIYWVEWKPMRFASVPRARTTQSSAECARARGSRERQFGRAGVSRHHDRRHLARGPLQPEPI